MREGGVSAGFDIKPVFRNVILSDGRVSRVDAADERVCCGGAAEHSVNGAEAALKDEGPVVKSTAQIKNLCCCILL